MGDSRLAPNLYGWLPGFLPIRLQVFFGHGRKLSGLLCSSSAFHLPLSPQPQRNPLQHVGCLQHCDLSGGGSAVCLWHPWKWSGSQLPVLIPRSQHGPQLPPCLPAPSLVSRSQPCFQILPWSLAPALVSSSCPGSQLVPWFPPRALVPR